MVPVKESLNLIVFEQVYWLLAALALALGVATVGLITTESSSWLMAFCFYSAATAARLGAGHFMNRMGEVATTDTTNAWNDKYHRFVVIALNAGVGAVLLGMLWWKRWDYGAVWGNKWGLMEARWFLTTAVILYLIAQLFTRPNTFGARVRSAALTVVLVGTMAHLAWPGQWGWWVLMVVIVLHFVLLRLRALQRRFGWADR